MSRRGSLIENPENTFQHNVGQGETLASIAAKYKSTVGEIKLLNRLMNDMVFPEQVLHIPEEPLTVMRRKFKSESETSADYSDTDGHNKLGIVTEENHDEDHDNEGKQEGREERRGGGGGEKGGGKGDGAERGGRRGSGGLIGGGLKVNENKGAGARRSSVVGGIGISSIKNLAGAFKGNKNNKNYDSNDKNKKSNNAINKTNHSTPNFDQLNLPKPKSNVFSATLQYITGAENVSGLLAITANDIRFEPFKKVDRENPEGKQSLNAVYDLVKHRMSLANVLFSACLFNQCPLRAETDEEKDSEKKSAPTPASNKTYKCLCLRLVKKKNIRTGQTPFLEVLIRNVLPGPKYYEHFFQIPTEIIGEFETFMRYYYYDRYNRPDEELDEDLNATLPNVTDIQTKRETFRRTLSVAELCNLALPEMSEASHVFTDGHIRVFREFLPPRVDGRPWELGYASWKHGFSLSTMYRCMENQPADSVALLIIGDTSHHVFGALICGGGVKKNKTFYGTGESFLFTFHNFFQKFAWSGENDCVAKGVSDMFIVGAFESKFGLCIEENLEKGFTYACKTFNSEPLTSGTSFTIHTIEVWSFPMELSS